MHNRKVYLSDMVKKLGELFWLAVGAGIALAFIFLLIYDPDSEASPLRHQPPAPTMARIAATMSDGSIRTV